MQSSGLIMAEARSRSQERVDRNSFAASSASRLGSHSQEWVDRNRRADLGTEERWDPARKSGWIEMILVPGTNARPCGNIWVYYASFQSAGT